MALKILVRAARDASAVKHAIRLIVKDPSIRVESLGGARGEKLCEAALEAAEPLSIILLDRNAPRECTIRRPLVEVVRSRASKIRNLPLQSIASLISWGRAGLRLRYSWRVDAPALAAYLGEPLENIPVHPEGDSFILYRKGLEVLASLAGAEARANPGEAALFIKSAEGVYTLYESQRPSLSVRFTRDSVKPQIISGARVLGGFRLERLIDNSRAVLRTLERVSLELLSNIDADRIIVPLSGGKDSAAALVLAAKAFGPEKVIAVYVDTGIDFLENRETVEKIAAKLGVDLYTVDAGVDRGLLHEGLPLPSPDNRWCTGRKLEALRRAVKKLSGNREALIVVGDRDAESGRRSARPPMRFDERLGLPSVAPLKYWSGAHVQAYLHLEGLPVNPLYFEGFLRLGCYLCFALRPSWELQILARIAYYERRVLREKPWQADLVRRFVSEKLGGSGVGLRGEAKPHN